MLRDLYVTHGPYFLTDYDSTGAVAVDTLTGYVYGLHVSENDTQSVETCAQKILRSACCDDYVTRANAISIAQLVSPEEATTTAGSLTVDDFDGYLIPSEDNAENLEHALE